MRVSAQEQALVRQWITEKIKAGQDLPSIVDEVSRHWFLYRLQRRSGRGLMRVTRPKNLLKVDRR